VFNAVKSVLDYAKKVIADRAWAARGPRRSTSSLVPQAGLEPALRCRKQILSLTRLIANVLNMLVNGAFLKKR